MSSTKLQAPGVCFGHAQVGGARSEAAGEDDASRVLVRVKITTERGERDIERAETDDRVSFKT